MTLSRESAAFLRRLLAVIRHHAEPRPRRLTDECMARITLYGGARHIDVAPKEASARLAPPEA